MMKTRDALKRELEDAIPAEIGDHYRELIADAVWVIVDAREVEWQHQVDLAKEGSTPPAPENAPDWKDDGSYGRPSDDDPPV